MSVYLSEEDRRAIVEARRNGDPVVNRFWTSLMSRTARRASSPGLFERGEDAEWWYPAAEYLSDAAMAYALQPAEVLAAWLRDVTLSIARRPESDWVGPWYRDHATQPAIGHLETAHLCWGLSAAIDLAPEVFSQGERDEILQALTAKGLVLCRRWLDRNTHLANWRSVLVAGIAAAAAVTGDRQSLEVATRETLIGAQAYQPDGSYAESLQYANYLALALMISYESITGATPELKPAGPEMLARLMPWFAQSMLYARPLDGWGAEPRARAVNFNDSAATFRPSGDVLLQVACRCRESMPTEAGLARWLFDAYHAPVPAQSPHNLATFGLRNDWGFLTLRFLARSAAPVSPAEAGLPVVKAYSNGNVFVRDRWEGQTVLAVQGGTQPLYGPGHLHGDLNSFMLVHNNQRLLVDPGHSCYRNLIHGLESSTQTHNTCAFLLEQDPLGLQEDLAKSRLLEQSNVASRRQIADGQVSEPVAPRGRLLLIERVGEVTAVASEAGALYGDPIQEFTRVWIQAGAHALFVIDRIRASRPVRTVWSWLLNNRDGASEFEVSGGRTLTMRRGLAGLTITHASDGRFNGPVHAVMHDAYHPEPNQLGEGHSGSGMLYRWIEPRPRPSRLALHLLAVDDYGLIHRWTTDHTDTTYGLADGNQRWRLTVAREEPLDLVLHGDAAGLSWRLIEQSGELTLMRDGGISRS
ncbi:MAG: heparinase II/III family protein [Phycisphaerae bacterium]|nr:heparinase II/III family protein [Phycisphaerae bacterium]